MKTVVLNECFLNNDHIKRLRDLGNLEVFNNTESEDQALERLQGADIAIMDGFICPPTTKLLESVDRLKLIVLAFQARSLFCMTISKISYPFPLKLWHDAARQIFFCLLKVLYFFFIIAYKTYIFFFSGLF